MMLVSIVLGVFSTVTVRNVTAPRQDVAEGTEDAPTKVQQAIVSKARELIGDGSPLAEILSTVGLLTGSSDSGQEVVEEVVQDVAQETEDALDSIQDVLWEQARELASEDLDLPEELGSSESDSPLSWLWPRFLNLDSWLHKQKEETKGEPAGGAEATDPTPTPAVVNAQEAQDLKPVLPLLINVEENADGTFTAYFGYENRNEFALYVPIGVDNCFEPAPKDRDQPTTFRAGLVAPEPDGILAIVFEGGVLKWTVLGESVTAVVLD